MLYYLPIVPTGGTTVFRYVSISQLEYTNQLNHLSDLPDNTNNALPTVMHYFEYLLVKMENSAR